MKRNAFCYVGFMIISLISCNESFHENDIEFRIRNNTSGALLTKSFNRGFGDAGFIEIWLGEVVTTGGGGIMAVDSFLFVRKTEMDSAFYINARHGGDYSIPNHFFELDNWTNEGNNKFHYTVTDADFER